MLGEPDDAGAGHLEVLHLPLDGTHHGRRIHLDGFGGDVPIEEVVKVFIGRHSSHDVVAGLGTRMIASPLQQQFAGVAVRDAGGQFLQGHIHKPIDGTVRLGHFATAHLRHPSIFERLGINGPRDGEVVPDGNGVTIFLRRPPVRPCTPDVFAAVHTIDRLEVVRQVVLGQQVDEEGAAHGIGEDEILRIPRIVSGEGSPQGIGHSFMRIPRFARGEMAFVQPLGCGGELAEQGKVGILRHGT